MAGTKRRLCACRLIGEVAGDGLVCCIESCTTVVAAVGPRRVSSVVSIDLRLRRIRRSAEGDGCSRVCRLCDMPACREHLVSDGHIHQLRKNGLLGYMIPAELLQSSGDKNEK